jgi:UDP-GlcNAc:undecaprenyl-phosphate/decaprenyl-phosphate GlcNAc-1-phosphate transferase
MLTALAMAMALSVVLVVFLKPLAPSVGLIDAPCIRKRHDGVIPLIGGVVVYLTLAVSALMFDFWQVRGAYGVILFGLPLLLIGAIDDRMGLSARLRFAVEILCVLAAIEFFGVQLVTLGYLFPETDLALGMLAVPVTVFGLVGVINSFNMTDGVDGLAGGLAFLIFSALAVLAYRENADVALQLMSFAAALFGFLWFNSRFFGRARAAIFMGDAGTLFLGFAIGWYVILLSQGPDAVIPPVAALWLFATPLFDTVSVMTRRVLRGQSPFHADREHLHHIFLLAGFGVNGSVLIILGFQLLFILYVFFSLHFGIPEWFSFALFLSVFGLYYWTMSRAWRVMKRVKQFREWAGFDDRRMAECEAANGRRSGVDRREVQLVFAGADHRKQERRRKDRRAL